LEEDEAFSRLMESEDVDIHRVVPLGDNGVTEVWYKEKRDFAGATNFRVNVAIASLVTSYARLRLYDVLSKIGRNVFYYDTISPPRPL